MILKEKLISLFWLSSLFILTFLTILLHFAIINTSNNTILIIYNTEFNDLQGKLYNFIFSFDENGKAHTHKQNFFFGFLEIN